MDRKEVAQLVDKLASKELSFGCMATTGNKKYVFCGIGKEGVKFFAEDLGGLHVIMTTDNQLEILGHPIMIGDVLEKIKGLKSLKFPFKLPALQKCVMLWAECGFTRSLQEIVQASGFEEHDIDCFEVEERLKDSNARALLEFINTINQN